MAAKLEYMLLTNNAACFLLKKKVCGIYSFVIGLLKRINKHLNHNKLFQTERNWLILYRFNYNIIFVGNSEHGFYLLLTQNIVAINYDLWAIII